MIPTDSTTGKHPLQRRRPRWGSRTTLVAATLQICLLAIATSPVAASIEHQPVGEDNLSGTRKTSGDGSEGLTGNGGYFGDSTDNVIQIEWDITRGSGTGFYYHYEYTFSGSAFNGGSHAVSSFVLDVSNDAFTGGELKAGVVENLVFSELNNDSWVAKDLGDFQPDPVAPNDGVKSNKGFIDGGVKFDIGDEDADAYRYAFDSNRSPVWGNFFLKNGGGSWPADLEPVSANSATYVANNALFQLRESGWGFGLDCEINWVAVPNGEVPEPAAMAIWSLLALAGIGLVSWRRRHQR